MGPWVSTECSKPCGGGLLNRTRAVWSPATEGGDACLATTQEHAYCNVQTCPAEDQSTECELSAWEDTSACSATECGSFGTKQQARQVSEQPGCVPPVAVELERTVPCESSTACVNGTAGGRDEDCVVSEWSLPSPCSEECGGGQEVLTREVLRPRSGQGAACPVLTRVQECNELPCVTVRTCRVGPWSAVSACSAPCGGGQQVFVRDIIVSPLGDVPQCPGLVQTVPCNDQACAPGTPGQSVETAGNQDGFTSNLDGLPGWAIAFLVVLVLLVIAVAGVIVQQLRARHHEPPSPGPGEQDVPAPRVAVRSATGPAASAEPEVRDAEESPSEIDWDHTDLPEKYQHLALETGSQCGSEMSDARFAMIGR